MPRAAIGSARKGRAMTDEEIAIAVVIVMVSAFIAYVVKLLLEDIG